ncbi:bilirubin oxidase [Pseudomonas cavernae]|uniref:Multicopper oxidase CueO n=1 Tax=Pseudomonas cavernae TaxID=2320867 RepID=A0A385YWE4_9PSED|nr:multicopper oxidase domain-containing protein [Pseudomonas cavernae]AYC31189.1 bilirubin oxidase [Pseudomonas cavernae]
MDCNNQEEPSSSPETTNNRRTFLKLGAAAMAAPLLLGSRPSAAKGGRDDAAEAAAAAIIPPSPKTTPWQEELPRAWTPIKPVAPDSFAPEPTEAADTSGGECGRAAHPRYVELIQDKPPLYYDMRAKERNDWLFHPDYPPQTIWGFADGKDGPAMIPGPLFVNRYGQPVLCRIYNELPKDHKGFGTPEISTHLHNLHAPSESDGFPGDYWSAHKVGPTFGDPEGKGAPGTFKDHFYPNVCAGYDEVNSDPTLAQYAARDEQGRMIGDSREALGTLWYHDHCLDFTAPNVVLGLAGFYTLYDELDSGDENDANPVALRLPSGDYDYPIALGDRRFDASGLLTFDQFSPEGTLGDKCIVNGKIEPVLRVDARKYRFRLLNSGPARFYALYLVDTNNRVQTFTYIANDGNLLPAPLKNQSSVVLGVAERADIVVDFSKYPIGTELYLVNRYRQDSSRGPKDIKAPGERVLKLIVDRQPARPDYSQVPDKLRELRPLPSVKELAALPVRRWEFARKGGVWTINGRQVDVNNPRAQIRQGQGEIWELVNPSGGWMHPVHIHFEEGRILSKTVDGTSVPVPVHERGRKDVYVLQHDSTIRLFMRFRDFQGKYVMHCHNVIHEDHAMMIRWDIT